MLEEVSLEATVESIRTDRSAESWRKRIPDYVRSSNETAGIKCSVIKTWNGEWVGGNVGDMVEQVTEQQVAVYSSAKATLHYIKNILSALS